LSTPQPLFELPSCRWRLSLPIALSRREDQLMPILVLIMISIGLMLHFLTPKQAGAQTRRLAFGLLFFPVLCSVARGLWLSLGILLQGALLAIIAPVLLFVVIRLVFGRAVYSEMMGHLVYDAVRWLGRVVITFFALGARLFGAAVCCITAAVRGRSAS
jgi:hypothetical protein